MGVLDMFGNWLASSVVAFLQSERCSTRKLELPHRIPPHIPCSHSVTSTPSMILIHG